VSEIDWLNVTWGSKRYTTFEPASAVTVIVFVVDNAPAGMATVRPDRGVRRRRARRSRRERPRDVLRERRVPLEWREQELGEAAEESAQQATLFAPAFERSRRLCDSIRARGERQPGSDNECEHRTNSLPHDESPKGESGALP
jgi:hypothetical protein